MKRNKKQIVLNEYKSLFKIKKEDNFEFGDRDDVGNVAVDEKTFDTVSDFVSDVTHSPKKQKHVIITHDKNKEEVENIDVLKREKRKINDKQRDVLTAQNFVGVIVTNDGTTIEILPKINTGDDDVQVRKTFLKMLCSLRQSPDNKLFNQANLNNAKMHLFEIFIEMFLSEVIELVRKGLKSDYVEQNQNEFFSKGKLDLKKHLQHNFVHKERFFVSFDEYKMDTPENRIIKTTIDFLFKITKDGKNKKCLREMKFVFDGVPTSHDLRTDFDKMKDNRMMRDYKLILQWCRVFLARESFTSFYGKNIALALLFDMNRVFEDYVTQCFVRDDEHCNVKSQKSGESLIVYPHKKFYLRPDLFFESDNGQEVIADTKWKLIDSEENKKNWNISQSDIYQMFAYGKKFNRNKIQLIYPKNENFNRSEEIKNMFFEYNDEDDKNNFLLEVLCFDCKKGKIV